jgi:hypothetical protein
MLRSASTIVRNERVLAGMARRATYAARDCLNVVIIEIGIGNRHWCCGPGPPGREGRRFPKTGLPIRALADNGEGGTRRMNVQNADARRGRGLPIVDVGITGNEERNIRVVAAVRVVDVVRAIEGPLVDGPSPWRGQGHAAVLAQLRVRVIRRICLFGTGNR